MIKENSATKIIRKATVFLATVLLVLAVTAPDTVYAQSVSITVIAHPETAPKSLTLAKLRAIFRGEKQWWPDKTRMELALMKTSTRTGETTAKKIYGMTANELNRFWVGKVFSGESNTPVTLKSEKALVDFVATTPGAIGVVSSSVVDTSVTSVPIDGVTLW